MGDTLRFGGTMEIAGLNEEINPVPRTGIIKSVTQYFPKFTPEDFAGVQPWRGLRPCSPDGLPYLGRTAKFRQPHHRDRPRDDGPESRPDFGAARQ